ncbi:hypothetical protein N7495_000220 [Penicillium taxi]|uniref:uncharacterized protein n=1 Tax=Penicillium taxi TaxID=168475 RepID=UPI002545132F|nr:uncharacterized protein N7495_000220 [Penicillium taxi]KAJ5907538.1 hypothetical protein N7495_000220 [Penicillium taxi]
MKLFAFGSNGSGQLGIGSTEDVSIPTECLFDTPPDSADNDEIVHISAGGNHTLLLTKRGYVYAAGCNYDGRCGTLESESKTPEENILRFRRVVLYDSTTASQVYSFKFVSATWEGSILVASVRYISIDSAAEVIGDRVYVLGSTPKGELGLGEKVHTAVPGTFIPNFPPTGSKITALASGMWHAVAVLSTENVCGWGASRKGQLGESLKAQKIAWKPSPVEGVPFRTTGALCGREFTVFLGRRDRGELKVFGDSNNRWGVLDVPSSLRLNDSSAVSHIDVGASWSGVYVCVAPVETSNSSSAVPPAGTLVAWGRNDRGQLPPSDLPPLTHLAVGSEHVVALLQDGSVAVFGWGEHGNCGLDTDPHGNVAGSYNLIPLSGDIIAAGEKVVRVGAGCATSWLIMS